MENHVICKKQILQTLSIHVLIYINAKELGFRSTIKRGFYNIRLYLYIRDTVELQGFTRFLMNFARKLLFSPNI